MCLPRYISNSLGGIQVSDPYHVGVLLVYHQVNIGNLCREEDTGLDARETGTNNSYPKTLRFIDESVLDLERRPREWLVPEWQGKRIRLLRNSWLWLLWQSAVIDGMRYHFVL